MKFIGLILVPIPCKIGILGLVPILPWLIKKFKYNTKVFVHNMWKPCNLCKSWMVHDLFFSPYLKIKLKTFQGNLWQHGGFFWIIYVPDVILPNSSFVVFKFLIGKDWLQNTRLFWVQWGFICLPSYQWVPQYVLNNI
jgi:hypothetical protein